MRGRAAIPVDPPRELEALAARAGAAGLAVLSTASWPESTADHTPPPLPGFVVSRFSPIVAEVAKRALRRVPARGPEVVTAVVVVSALGDVASAAAVAEAVDTGGRVWPLMFFQSVPNAVAGHVAARRQLTGPIVSVGDAEAGVEIAALLLEDGDADEVLVAEVDLAPADGRGERGAAVLVRALRREGST
ncbi:beta-ketoacyl synthase chain length factor [Actinospica robiniae]|uniref:beta-ketoacyl synthase chain length factor n=1 Tax=Actinospica robiniae TaxID=304901 RepID=UPI000400BBAF|nr:beta-ketoacyl synthase chain length factor [Actinospica robiniae]